MAKPANSVKEYLDSLPKDVKKTLSCIRKAIISAAPEAIESISYRIPFYRLNGHLAAIVSHKNHCSFVTMSHDVIKQFKDELKPFKVSGTTIQFQPRSTLPALLVKKIIKARMKENMERESKSKAKLKTKTTSKKS